MIKLMIVDDSLFMRAMVKDVISKNETIEIYKEARNGQEALEMIDDDVDVVLLDIEMPKMNGIDVLKQWDKNNIEVPVIMFSSLTKRGAKETIEALELGAIDFVEKPSSKMNVVNKAEEIVSKIKLAAATKKKTKSVPRMSSTNEKRKMQSEPRRKVFSAISEKVENVILIGCSTGGPKALKNILPLFPADLNAAIVIVQHMPKGDFIESLANSLNRDISLSVQVGRDGDVIKNSNVYIAPAGYQMSLGKKGTLRVMDVGPESGHAPSVDYLFRESLQSREGITLYPVVLTGMGADGSKSALLLSKESIETVVESEASCAVYGMPKKVVESGAKHRSMTLMDIPQYLIEKIQP